MADKIFKEKKSHSSAEKMEGAVVLPTIVSREIDLRENSEEDIEPNPAAIEALRKHFEYQEDKPLRKESFIDLLEKLGGTPRWNDTLVRGLRYNMNWSCCPPGGLGGECGQDWLAKQMKHHRERLRIIICKEFLERREAAGMVVNPRFSLAQGGESLDFERNRRKQMKSNNYHLAIDEDELSFLQLDGLSQAFINGFWRYVNHDKRNGRVYHLASASKTVLFRLCDELS